MTNVIQLCQRNSDRLHVTRAKESIRFRWILSPLLLWSNGDDPRGLLNATNISTNNEHISNNTWNAIHVQGLIIHPPPTLHSTACSTHLIVSHKIQRHGHIRGKFNPITHASFCPHRQHQCRRISAQPPSSTGAERHDDSCTVIHTNVLIICHTHTTHTE